MMPPRWQDNPGYDELFKYYLDNKYQLRYTGGMVPDVNQVNKVEGPSVHCLELFVCVFQRCSKRMACAVRPQHALAYGV